MLLRREKASDEETIVIIDYGSYSFVGPDNFTYVVNFTYDIYGFHPMIQKMSNEAETLGSFILLKHLSIFCYI